MEQGTQDWTTWRFKGIGASDVAAILGTSPWKSAQDLWEEKIGVKEQFAGNEYTRRGQELEPKVRELYNSTYGTDMKPALAEYQPWPILRCSLDGFDLKLGKIIEIKCPGPKDHATACSGQVPEKYKAQVQAQMLILDTDKLDYVSYDGENMVVVPVEPDKVMQALILQKSVEFWKMVEDKNPPALALTKNLDDDSGFYFMLTRYDQLIKEASEIEKEKAELKKAIEQTTGKISSRCKEFVVNYTERKGNVDYAAIPELNSVDLEKYRKPSSYMMILKKN